MDEGRNKTRLIILIVAILSLGACFGGYFWWMERNTEKQNAEIAEIGSGQPGGVHTDPTTPPPGPADGTQVATNPAGTTPPATDTAAPVAATPVATNPPVAAAPPPEETAPATAPAEPAKPTPPVTPVAEKKPAPTPPASKPAPPAEKPPAPVATAPVEKTPPLPTPVKPVAQAPAPVAIASKPPEPVAVAAPTAQPTSPGTPEIKNKFPAVAREEVTAEAKQVAGRTDPMIPFSGGTPFPFYAKGLNKDKVADAGPAADLPPVEKPSSKGKIKDLDIPPPPSTPNLNEGGGFPGGGIGGGGGLPLDQLPAPPSKPTFGHRLTLTAVIGNKAMFRVPVDLRFQNKWPAVIALSPGEQFESLNVVSVENDSVTIDEDGERSVKTLPPVR